MAESKYLTAPVPSTKMPKAISFILANEAAERFAFYGVVAIQTVFMVNYLQNWQGEAANFSEAKAMEWIHSFKALVYALPILGALLSDLFLGKFKTIIPFSALYCVGFIALIVDQSYTGALVGFGLIAVGSGMIKPCISANVGDQFGKSNEHLMSKVFSWFYFSINFGSFLSTALIPYLLDKFGPQIAFAVPGIFMFIATITYWLGRKQLVHIPAKGAEFVKESFSADGVKAVLKLFLCVYVFVAIFWALFDQTTSKWVLQAEKMDLNLLGVKVLPSQLQAVNPLLVMLMIPLFSYIIYPMVGKIVKVTPLRKIATGFFVGGLAFAISAYIDTKLNGGDIFKFTSSQKSKSFSTAMIIDGKEDGAGWSSLGQPTSSEPQELIVRLRQRQQWNISQVNLTPYTSFNVNGILDVLKSVKLDIKQQLRSVTSEDSDVEVSADTLKERVKIIDTAMKDVKKTAKDQRKYLTGDAKKDTRNTQVITAVRTVALTALEQVDADVELLNDLAYLPKEISVYAADFTDKLIPFLTDKLAAEKKELEASLEKEMEVFGLTNQLLLVLIDELSENNEKVDELLKQDKGFQKIAKMQEELGDLTEKLSNITNTTVQSGWTYLGDFTVDSDGGPVALDFEPINATHVLLQVKSNYGAQKVRIGELKINTTQSMPETADQISAQIWPNIAAIGFKPNIIWQVIAYILITAAEVMLSITVLEFSYTQAPKKMKSFVSSVSLLSITLGNFFVIGVNKFIQKPDGTTTLEGADYYWFFVKAIIITGVLFSIVAIFFKEKTYLQDEAKTEE